MSIDYDPGINNGIFSISAYAIQNNGSIQHFGLGISDSFNFVIAPKEYLLLKKVYLVFIIQMISVLWIILVLTFKEVEKLNSHTLIKYLE